ncbi:MAG: hypothetical protein AAGI08_13270 [Bacteroidota bacterium]
MKRLNFTLDADTIRLLERLAGEYYGGNKSQTVRAALESLASHVGHDGWIVSGHVPVAVDADTECHTCNDVRPKGAVLYRPVFERGRGPDALPSIPVDSWLDCPSCVEGSE